MTELPFPLAGSTLIVGPSNVGKTRLTARALASWIDENGPEGVVVLEFGPEHEHEGRVLGRRLARFVSIPDAAWEGVLDARAPRAEGETTAAAVALAEDNAERAARILEAAPADPRAVFVNDATIPVQTDLVSPSALADYCDRAAVAVLNAFESDELGTDDPVSRREQQALEALRGWADRVVELDGTEE